MESHSDEAQQVPFPNTKTQENLSRISNMARRLLQVPHVLMIPVCGLELVPNTPVSDIVAGAGRKVVLSGKTVAMADLGEHEGAFLGVPVLMDDGRIAAVLCAISLQPRAWTEEDTQMLVDLAALAATEFAKAEAEARKTLLQQMIDSLFAFVGLMTPDGVLVEANPAALHAASVDPSTILGKRLEESYMWLHDPDEQHRLRQAIAEAAAGKRVRYDVRVRLGNDLFITVDFALAPVFDAEGRVTHIVPSAVDISPRLRAEDQIRFQAHMLNVVEQSVIATDVQGQIIFWNKFAERLYGWQADEVLGRSIIEVTPTSMSQEQAVEIFANLQRGQSWSGEFFAQRRDGSQFWAYVSDSPIVDAHGQLIGIIGVSHDISERKRATDQLAHLQQITAVLSQMVSPQEIMRAVLDEGARTLSATAGQISLVSNDGRMLEIQESIGLPNHMTERYQRYSLGDLKLPSADVIRTGTAQWFASHAELAAHYPRARELDGLPQLQSCAVLPLVADRRVFGTLSLLFGQERPFSESDRDFLSAIASQCAQALTRARSYEAEQRARQELQELNVELERRVIQRTDQLRNSRDRLRELAARLQSAREEERTRIAREVHDVIGQSMTAIKMSTAMLGRRLQQERSPSIERVHEIIALLDDAIRSVRRVATELRPSILDDMGLVAAVEWYVRDFATRFGLAAEFECAAHNIPMSSEKATALYRLVQEALTNVARHAQATQVRVELREDDDSLFVQVQDNGRGISPDAVSGAKSLGLVGMLERVHEFAGTIDIVGVPDLGTTVTVRLPVDGAA